MMKSKKQQSTREILEQFPKAVLIEYFCSRLLVRKHELEYDLVSIHWEQESAAALADMQAAGAERSKHEFLTAKWMAAEKQYQAACKRYDRSDRLYKKMEELREARKRS